MNDTVVTRWFGAGFARLDPLLQQLHRDGGVLQGAIDLDVRPAGRRLARRLGIPVDRPRCDFSVAIRHERDALVWERRFDAARTLRSVFVPHGRWPDGYWIETTGAFALRLAVDVVDGGWHWRLLGTRIAGIPLPAWLMPTTHAFKRIEQGRYRFDVEIAQPPFGKLLGYGGLLDVAPHA